jgi:SAM-dependent methyltransferase
VTADGATRFFDAIATRYDRVYAPDRESSKQSLGAVLAVLPPKARVLDLGVGTGRELSALLDAGHSPTGVDVSGRMLEICARRSRPVPLVRADFWQALPFDAGAFDAVLALHGTIAHPPDEGAHQRLAGEAARVLSPGGVFVAEVPSPAWLAELPASGLDDGERRIRRTGPASCVHEDLVTGVSIETVVLSGEEWRAVFASWPGVDVMDRGAELVVIARKQARSLPIAS